MEVPGELPAKTAKKKEEVADEVLLREAQELREKAWLVEAVSRPNSIHLDLVPFKAGGGRSKDR